MIASPDQAHRESTNTMTARLPSRTGGGVHGSKPGYLNVAVCGGLNWDFIFTAPRLPNSGETYNASALEQCPGGKGADVAIGVHRLSHNKPPRPGPDAAAAAAAGTNGHLVPPAIFSEAGDTPPQPVPESALGPDLPEIQVHLIGSTGDDIYGHWMRRNLIQHHVLVDQLHQPEQAQSAIAVISVESEGGENRILVHPGANHFFTPERFRDVAAFGPTKPDLLISQIEFARPTVEQLLLTAHAADIETLLNPSPAAVLDYAVYRGLDHLVMNESEAAILKNIDPAELENDFRDWDRITDHYLDLGVKHVVVTLGAQGAFYSKEKGRGTLAPAIFVHPDLIKNTSGAGDVFVAAYVMSIIEQRQKGQGKWDMRRAVEYANRASSRIIQEVGPQMAIPWHNELIGASNE